MNRYSPVKSGEMYRLTGAACFFYVSGPGDPHTDDEGWEKVRLLTGEIVTIVSDLGPVFYGDSDIDMKVCLTTSHGILWYLGDVKYWRDAFGRLL